MSGLFLLSEAHMRRIAPYFSLSHGVPRVDDRRVITGIPASSIAAWIAFGSATAGSRPSSNSPMSAPPEKNFPAPVRTIPRQPPPRSAARATFKSCQTCAVRSLTGGLSICSTQKASQVSRLTVMRCVNTVSGESDHDQRPGPSRMKGAASSSLRMLGKQLDLPGHSLTDMKSLSWILEKLVNVLPLPVFPMLRGICL